MYEQVLWFLLDFENDLMIEIGSRGQIEAQSQVFQWNHAIQHNKNTNEQTWLEEF